MSISDNTEQGASVSLKEAWSYAVYRELPILLDKKNLRDKCRPIHYDNYIEKNNIGANFYACLAYLWLNDILSEKTIGRMSFTVKIADEMEDDSKPEITDVLEPFYKEFHEKHRFHDDKSLDSYMEKNLIPKWFFYAGKEIVRDLFPNCLLVEDILYYIEANENDEPSYLTEIRTSQINKRSGISSLNIFSKRICSGPSQMLHYDELNKILYMNYQGLEKSFLTYNISSKECELVNGKFILCHKGKPFFETKDGYLAYSSDNRTVKLEKYNRYASYLEKKYDSKTDGDTGSDDWLLVCPDRSTARHFFRPYRLYISDGRREETERKVEEEILWMNVFAPYKAYMIVSANIKNLGKVSLVPKSSRLADVEKLVKYCEADRIPSDQIYLNNLKEIIKIIRRYGDDDFDTLDLFYTLCQTAGEIDHCDKFPSENFVKTLKKLDQIDKGLDNPLLFFIAKSNYNAIHDELIALSDEEDDLDSFILNYYPEKDEINSKNIGYFGTYNRRFLVNKMKISEGIVAGELILPKECLKDVDVNWGIVTYNFRKNEFYITTNFKATSRLRKQIIEKFGLSSENSYFITQRDAEGA